jgi:hypothetical protein
LRIGDDWLKPDHIDDASDKVIQSHKYSFRTELTCNKLEKSEIEVFLESDPPEANLSTRIRYKHHWRIEFEGM